MPIGTAGKAMLLLSGGIDSPVAGYMIAKRGVQIEATYFHAPPYTSDRAKQKVVDLAKLVSRYSEYNQAVLLSSKQKLNLIVESSSSFFVPIATSVELSPGLFDEHAEPDDTYIFLSSSACKRTSARTPSNPALTTCGALSRPLIPFICTPSSFFD